MEAFCSIVYMLKKLLSFNTIVEVAARHVDGLTAHMVVWGEL